jgi:hypothetical protein
MKFQKFWSSLRRTVGVCMKLSYTYSIVSSCKSDCYFGKIFSTLLCTHKLRKSHAKLKVGRGILRRCPSHKRLKRGTGRSSIFTRQKLLLRSRNRSLQLWATHDTDATDITRVVVDAIDQKFGNTAFMPRSKIFKIS